MADIFEGTGTKRYWAGNWLCPGLDYRGAGGYAVAPPSAHESGREYVWKS